MGKIKLDFDALLAESSRLHGHLCPGQVLGVRMSVLGLREVDIDDPKGKGRKDIIVFVEMDRCATDAIQSVTGCSLGKRTMKFMDYGKMAATFVNLKTGKAIRVLAKEESRHKAKEYCSGAGDKYAAQLEAYREMADSDLFDIMEVKVTIKREDLPGRPLGRVLCDQCGEYVQDMRHRNVKGKTLCRPCSGERYYISEEVFFLPRVMQECHNDMEIKSKLWIEIKGEAVFGRGRRFLLQAIDRYGSIRHAAKEVNISYRKAWSYVKAMEERLGIALVERRAGGRNGGGATLTDDAREFLAKYEMIEDGVRELVDERFRRVFGIKR